MAIKKCKICGKEFLQHSNNAIYCSYECKKEASRKWYHSHKKSKKINNMDKIKLLNIEALEHGTSYGKYVAMKEYPNKIVRKKA